jgi:hypothetical protein
MPKVTKVNAIGYICEQVESGKRQYASRRGDVAVTLYEIVQGQLNLPSAKFGLAFRGPIIARFGCQALALDQYL